MKRLSFAAALFSALALGQTYDCSTMQYALANVQDPSCGAFPGSYTITWNRTVTEYNTRTNSVVATKAAMSSAPGWCACAGLKCGGTLYPQTAPAVWESGGNWNYYDYTIGIEPGGNLLLGGCGCRGQKTGYSDSVAMPIQSCPCVASTCGYAGCPACLVCPTPNNSCHGRYLSQQNVCIYVGSGCGGSTPVLFELDGAPCCRGSGTPIIIDVDGSGFELTSAKGGVSFDFFGTGQAVQIAWTARGSTNGFLVRDLYGTGKIINAKEMFGNLTEQPSCSDPNGFRALAQYDRNGDGWIDAQDVTIWPSLLVWQDANHNGITDPGELHSLESLGIKRIGLKYKERRQRDRFGNEFRYQGLINDDGARFVYDVILVME